MTAPLNHPVPFRARRSMAVCTVGGKLVFFGGVGAAGTESILDVANDCWIFNPSTLIWQQVKQHDPWPSPRRCVGVAPTYTGMYLWGGSGLTEDPEGHLRYTFLNDWWHFDLVSGLWSLLRDSDDHRDSPITGASAKFPSPRYTPVFQTAAGRFFLFGGYTEDRLGKRKLNDTWICEDETWQPVEVSGEPGYGYGAKWPGLRYGCMSTAVGGCVFVFGGFSDEGEHNDLWRFDTAARAWELIVPESSGPGVPAARYCSAIAYHKEKLFLFGGRSRRFPKVNFNDLWAFDLVQDKWECLNGNRAPHLYDESAPFPAYHAKTSAAVVDGFWYLWGGEGLSGHVSDFWRFSFDACCWEMLQAARQDDPVFW